MQTRHSTKSTRIFYTTPRPNNVDDMADMDDLAGPVITVGGSSSSDTTIERDQTLSKLSQDDLTTSRATPPATSLNRDPTHPAGSATPIERLPGLPPRGQDAIASFPNNINNMNPSNYIWVRGSSNYTLCHNSTGEPAQALLWVVGNNDHHSLGTAITYENWTVDIVLSADTDNALDGLLKTGPRKRYTKPNRYCILRAQATLSSVREDLRDDDDESFTSLGQTITANDPFPYTYNGCMVIENGTMPASGYDASNFGKQTSVAVEISILGYQMEGKAPGYSFAMRGVYHLGTLHRGQRRHLLKNATGGASLAQGGARLESSMRIRHGTTNVRSLIIFTHSSSLLLCMLSFKQC
jgi:hypothetical protein